MEHSKLDLESWIKVLTMLGALGTFTWGIVQFSVAQRLQAESRHLEARKPFLDRQLILYTEITRTAAVLAAGALPGDDHLRGEAERRFWELYWGELALVEDRGVEAAMVEFGDAIKAGGMRNVPTLRLPSLALARACRNSLAESWGVADWRSGSDKAVTR